MSSPVMKSSDAQRVYTLSRVEQKRLVGKLIKLEDIEKTLDIAIKDVNKASKNEYFWQAMEVSAKPITTTA